MLNFKSVLIIGGNGFVGSHILDLLVNKKYKVRVLSRSPEKFRELNSEVDYRFGDFQSPQFINECLEGIDIVIHLISSNVPSNSNKDINYDINVNIISGINLLNGMINNGVKKIIFLSSGGAIYGNPKQIPTPEDYYPNPISSYGIQKMVFEQYLKLFNRQHGIDYFIARVSNLYGDRQGKSGLNGFINTILENVISNKETIVFGDGNQYRDYLYIKDLINLIEKVLENNLSGTYNVGSGKGNSLLEIIDLVTKITSKTPKINFKEKRLFDVDKIVLDIKKAKTEINWEPKYSLEEGIKELFEIKTSSKDGKK